MPHPAPPRYRSVQAGAFLRRFLLPALFLAAAVSAAGIWRVASPVDARASGDSPSTSSPSAPPPARVGARQSEAAAEPLEAEIVTLRRTGFEPSVVTRPKGRFVLGVNNRSGEEVSGLKLEREAGDQVVQSRRWADLWRDELDLPPGRYLLRVNDRPEWTCSLTITAR